MQRFSLVLVGLLALTVQIYGQIPRTISYQGVLCDATGKPKPDNSYEMTFRLYQDSSGGSAVWSEHKNLQVTRGLFHTMLGDAVIIPPSLLFDKPYWLAIQVGSEEELTPRIPFSSVPFSFAAMTAGPWQQSGSKLFYAGGNVGIGTSNPNFPLEIRDGIAVTGSGEEGGQLSLMNGEGSGNGWIVDNYGTGGNEVLRFFKQQGSSITHALELSGSGNVGIGGFAGSERLEVAGTIKSNSGGFKFPDGTVQTTAAAGGGSGPWQASGSDISYSSGNVGIGTSSPAAKLHIVDGNLLLSGTTGETPISGSGTRLMWIPSKGAFRAGTVGNNSWDDANIGRFSAGMGENTEARGYASFAVGQNATASAMYSVAMGSNTTASGLSSLAMGQNTTASGVYCVAMGNNIQASGYASFAMGYRTAAIGDYSTAMGYRTTASGGNATAIGNSVSTNGKEGSFIIGDLSDTSTVSNNHPNEFVAVFAGGYTLWSTRNLNQGVYMIGNTSGWTNISDRNKKENFRPLDGEELLSKIRSMSITEWNYRQSDPSIKYIGPVAQEFHAAFHLGGTDSLGINSISIDGVNMAAVQALEKRTTELREKTAKLEAVESRVVELEARLARLEQALAMPKELTQQVSDENGSQR